MMKVNFICFFTLIAFEALQHRLAFDFKASGDHLSNLGFVNRHCQVLPSFFVQKTLLSLITYQSCGNRFDLLRYFQCIKPFPYSWNQEMTEQHSVPGPFSYPLPRSLGLVKQGCARQWAMPVRRYSLELLSKEQRNEALSTSVWFLVLYLLTHP